MRIDRSIFATILWQTAIIVAIFSLWQWAATAHRLPYLPQLGPIGAGYLRLVSGDLLSEAVLPSLYRLLVGFSIAVVLGSIIGLAIGTVKTLAACLQPLLEYLRFIPAVVILPPAIFLLGPTDGMRIAVIAFGSIFPVLLAAMDGARRVDSLLIDVARVHGLSVPARVFRIVLPAALPQIFAGARVALSIALVMMVLSELIAADNGLGFYILRNQRLFQTANVYAGVLVIGTVGLALTLSLLAVERRVLSWHRGWRGLDTKTS